MRLRAAGGKGNGEGAAKSERAEVGVSAKRGCCGCVSAFCEEKKNCLLFGAAGRQGAVKSERVDGVLPRRGVCRGVSPRREGEF